VLNRKTVIAAGTQSGNSRMVFTGRRGIGLVIKGTLWQFGNRQLNREFDMSFKKASLAAMLAVSMAGTPALAQTAAPASKLSVATAHSARAGANATDANELAGGWVIPLLAVLAAIAGIIALASDGGDRPSSP